MRPNVLVADPPWPFKDGLPGQGRGAAKHYPLLSIKELCEFPLPEMEHDAVLFLWRVASMTQAAEDVAAAWGFTPKTELVWCKRTTHGKRHFGMGRIVRAEHEVCMIATRGNPPPVLRRDVRSTFEATVGRHSEKPDEFYEIVESLYAGPYAELFARRKRPGWLCFGNEVEQCDISSWKRLSSLAGPRVLGARLSY